MTMATVDKDDAFRRDVTLDFRVVHMHRVRWKLVVIRWTLVALSRVTGYRLLFTEEAKG